MPPSVPVLPLSISNLHSETSNPTDNDHDRISLSYDGTLESLTQRLDYAQLYTLTYSKPSEAPSAAHLAALLITISTHGGPTSTIGSTAEHTNAWFAYSVIEVLREIFSGKGKANKKWARGGMRVDPPDRVDVLVRKYTSTWENFSRKMGSTSQRLQHDSEQQDVAARRQQAKVDKKAEIDAFADMLRTMGS